MGSWTPSHGEMILNCSANYWYYYTEPDCYTRTVLSRLGDSHSIVLPRNQCLAPQASQTRIELKSHTQLFRPYWGSSVWCTDGCVGMTGYQYMYLPPGQALVVSTQADREATVYGVALEMFLTVYFRGCCNYICCMKLKVQV